MNISLQANPFTVPVWRQLLPLHQRTTHPLSFHDTPCRSARRRWAFPVMVAKHLGIVHPPGYPLFTGIAHLFL